MDNVESIPEELKENEGHRATTGSIQLRGPRNPLPKTKAHDFDFFRFDQKQELIEESYAEALLLKRQLHDRKFKFSR